MNRLLCISVPPIFELLPKQFSVFTVNEKMMNGLAVKLAVRTGSAFFQFHFDQTSVGGQNIVDNFKLKSNKFCFSCYLKR